MLIKEANKNVGGLSKTSKMPCYSWSISAELCNVGSTLAQHEGTVCYECYALKGFYHMPNVKESHARSLEAFQSNPQLWAESMVFLIQKRKMEYFRWFDSGDLQGMTMLWHIVEIAKACESTKFWLPTKEYAVVKAYLSLHGEFPSNLNVRVSAPKKHEKASFRPFGTTTSTVGYGEITCPAFEQDHQCLDCRACWDRKVTNVNYKAH